MHGRAAEQSSRGNSRSPSRSRLGSWGGCASLFSFDRAMNYSARGYSLGVAYLVAWTVLGFWAIPLSRRIFAEWLAGPSLPPLTVALFSLSPVVCLVAGFTGAACIAAADCVASPVALRRCLLVALSAALVVPVVGLLLPLI